jgi:hypothetical protein
MKVLPGLMAFALLTACQQAANPYKEESIPYPPAPAAAADNFDRSNYPPAQRDFGLYHSWAWRNDVLPAGSGWVSSQLLVDSISASLDQSGLRPVQGKASPDLLVTANVLTRQIEINEPPRVGGFYGRGPWGDGYGVGVGGGINSTQQVLHVQIDMYDAHSGQLVWSGNSAEISGYGNADQPENLREAVSKAMQSFPVR